MAIKRVFLLCVPVSCSHGSPSRSAAHTRMTLCARTPGVSLCWPPLTQRGSCCWMVRSSQNQYLPMPSETKPPIHIHSILRSSEYQVHQLDMMMMMVMMTIVLCTFQALIRLSPTPVSAVFRLRLALACQLECLFF